MSYLTVVEAAGLSGLPPETIRDLIRSGRVPATTVLADTGRADLPAYLIESDLLPRLASSCQTAAAEIDNDAESPDGARLRRALLGLRAALARRQVVSANRPARTAAPTACARRASGLSRSELRALSSRVDRLLWSSPDNAD
jgi:hypothetical protein